MSEVIVGGECDGDEEDGEDFDESCCDEGISDVNDSRNLNMKSSITRMI